jgi:hypothetical protein
MPKNWFLGMALVLGQAIGFGASDSGTGTLWVAIRPAAELAVSGSAAVNVKIRLHSQAQAKLWRSDVCVAPPAAGHVIPASGIYNVPIASIAGEGGKVCLAASDGTISKEVALPAGTL